MHGVLPPVGFDVGAVYEYMSEHKRDDKLLYVTLTIGTFGYERSGIQVRYFRQTLIITTEVITVKRKLRQTSYTTKRGRDYPSQRIR